MHRHRFGFRYHLLFIADKDRGLDCKQHHAEQQVSAASNLRNTNAFCVGRAISSLFAAIADFNYIFPKKLVNKESALRQMQAVHESAEKTKRKTRILSEYESIWG